MSSPVFVCPHGHFYQPPREHPSLDVVEREESAHPYHDWNERIAAECYAPNAAARILGPDNRAVGLSNNYRWMSFNVGPTLMAWLAEHEPDVVDAMIAADRQGARALHGHGPAMAQAYNHLILPLANKHDKRTQVRWGLAAFDKTFGRKSEGMWLAETACDDETLDVLADEGVTFTVLAPSQAARWRFLDGGEWHPCTDGSIPSGRSYVRQRKNRRPVHLFFYDSGLARGVAFEGLLRDATHLVDAVQGAHARRTAPPGEPWLVHWATDGESYGHHFKFGDMALGAALLRMRRDPRFSLTSYGAFLARYPVRAEVDIVDVSSWSCAHGVGRWSRDCGCAIAPHSGFNQAWRAPLREGLNVLRDELARHFERSLGALVEDPWAVRDAYIEVVLDRTRARDFAQRMATRPLDDDERVRFFRLLESQRFAMLMFTSCGWFFDDVTGLETTVILRHAARAVALARATGAADIDASCAKILADATSNVVDPDGRRRTGQDVYRAAQASLVDPTSIAASLALASFIGGARAPASAFRVAAFQAKTLVSPTPAAAGRVMLEDRRTTESVDLLFAAARGAGLDVHSAVLAWPGEEQAEKLIARVGGELADASRFDVDEIVAQSTGGVALGFHDLPRDARYAIGAHVATERLRGFIDLGRALVDAHQPLLKDLARAGVHLDAALEGFVGHVLVQAAREEASRCVLAAADPAVDDASFQVALTRLSQAFDDARALQAPKASTMAEPLVDALVRFCRAAAQGDPSSVVVLSRVALAAVRAQVTSTAPRLALAAVRLAERAEKDEALLEALQRACVLTLLDQACQADFLAKRTASPDEPDA